MQNIIRITSIFLLLINGVGACYGGWQLFTDPTGKSMQLTIEWLQFSPFNDYLIPGIILFVANGLLSLIIAFLVIIRYEKFPMLIVLQGNVLFIWIIIEMFLIQTIHPLHIIMGAVGIVLILLGFLIWNKIESNHHAE